MKRKPYLFKREDIFRKWEKVGKQDIPKEKRFTFRDIFAMIAAVISIVLPWVLAIMASLGLVLFLIWKFYLKG